MADDADHAKGILKLVYITCLIIVGVLVLFLLHVLGSIRRRSSNKFLHIVVLTAYTFSYALVSYTLGLMQESSYYFNEFSVWAVCLLMLLGGTDNLMACELNDVDNWKSYHVKHLFQGVLVVYIVAAYTNSDDARQYRSPLWAILFVNGLQSFVRSKSMMMASKSNLLCKNVKPIVEYMKLKENQQLSSDATMKGCRYIVAGEQELGKQPVGVDNMKITTVGQVWQSEGSLLCSHSKRSKRLKDICLSMALSKMLNRRFAGFKIAEDELANAHDFVFNGLLSGDDGDERCERTFRVIEKELGFIYDLYYTRYPYLYHKVRHFALCLPVAMVIFCSWLTYVLFKKNKEAVGQNESISLSTTLFLMAVVTFLEAFQLYLHLASDWFKVALIRSYVTRPALQRSRCFGVGVINLALRLPAFRPWEKKLGQYSLLQNYDRTCRARNCCHYVTLWLVDKHKAGIKGGKLVKLSKQVKEAVIGSLVRSKDDDLKKVIRSPRIHTELSWALGGTATQNILVWHIATTICKYYLDTARAKQHGKQIPALSAEESSAVDTACTLSQYCAYLIAFAPDLLPDHSFDSAYELETSIREAGVLLGDAKTMEAKCKELTELSIKVASITGGAPIDLKGIEVTNIASAPLVVKGARLASQLMKDSQDGSMQWKVLSDFWADMVLYIAPCDDAQGRAHLEALARGGEFITHLWVLLSHAGIVERAPNGLEVV